MSRSRLVVLTATAAAVAGGTIAAGPASAARVRVSLSFTQPTASVPRLQLTAAAPAAARSVVFRARWKGADGVVRTRRLGVDEVASNGFGIGWDASAVPRATTVSLTVQARDAAGRILNTSKVRTWRSPGSAATTPTDDDPDTTTSTTGHAATVVGECVPGGECVVAVRSAPTTASERVAELAAGTKVTVQCRKTGQTVRTPAGTSSDWVRIGEDRWVYGPYVRTASTAAKVPACVD